MFQHMQSNFIKQTKILKYLGINLDGGFKHVMLSKLKIQHGLMPKSIVKTQLMSRTNCFSLLLLNINWHRRDTVRMTSSKIGIANKPQPTDSSRYDCQNRCLPTTNDHCWQNTATTCVDARFTHKALRKQSERVQSVFWKNYEQWGDVRKRTI